jgi:hypothetical protein
MIKSLIIKRELIMKYGKAFFDQKILSDKNKKTNESAGTLRHQKGRSTQDEIQDGIKQYKNDEYTPGEIEQPSNIQIR